MSGTGRAVYDLQGEPEDLQVSRFPGLQGSELRGSELQCAWVCSELLSSEVLSESLLEK